MTTARQNRGAMVLQRKDSKHVCSLNTKV